MGKKIMGWVLLFLAGALAFGTLGTLGSIIKAVGTFFLGILGKATADETAQAFGAIIAQTIFCFIIYYSWVYGRKWTRKTENPLEPTNLTKPDSSEL